MTTATSKRSTRVRLSPWGRHVLQLVVEECDTPVLTTARIAAIATEYGLDAARVEYLVERELVPLGWVRRE
ncbi:hypothetical protein PYV61_05105 [Roseisolibacter sp. H3M3-2]|nr:hypothetical protein [Roseisolibacter sp. H3M3-2]